MNLTASDRSALIRLAGSLPVGDETRRAILSGLKQVHAASTPPKKVLNWLKKYRAPDGIKVDAVLGLDGQPLTSDLNPGDRFLEWTYTKTFKRHPIYSDAGGEVLEPTTYLWAIGANGLPDPEQDGLGHAKGHVKRV